MTWRLSQESMSEWCCVYICVSISMPMVSFRVSSLNHSKNFTWMLMHVYSMFVSTAEDGVYHCIASPSLSAAMWRNWVTEKSFTLPESILNKLKVRLGKVSGFCLCFVHGGVSACLYKSSKNLFYWQKSCWAHFLYRLELVCISKMWMFLVILQRGVISVLLTHMCILFIAELLPITL